jgi:hypothetical protein
MNALSICRVFALSCMLILAAGSAARAEQIAFDLRIERGQVPAAMRVIRIKQGDEVTLRWISDRLAVLHLHGYDIERTVQPGAPAEMRFTARATGRFSITRGAPKTGGHTHEAAIVTLEVLPR